MLKVLHPFFLFKFKLFYYQSEHVEVMSNIFEGKRMYGFIGVAGMQVLLLKICFVNLNTDSHILNLMRFKWIAYLESCFFFNISNETLGFRTQMLSLHRLQIKPKYYNNG